MCRLVFNSDPMLQRLLKDAHGLIASSLRPSTRSTYAAAYRVYHGFTSRHNLRDMPASEDQLLCFIAFMAQQGIKHSSIGVYLAAIRSRHLMSGFPDPTMDRPRIRMAQRALALAGSAPVQKLPITLEILRSLAPHCGASTHGARLLWAAMNLAVFGCLRTAELCPQGHFDPRINITRADVSFVSTEKGDTLRVRIKASKTDQQSLGFHLFSRCTSDTVCAYCAVRSYRSHLPPAATDAPFFSTACGLPLTRRLLINQLKLILNLAGYDPARYSGHSFRAGGATSAAAAGFADWEIQLLGRWSSDTYKRYIRAAPELLASFAERMVSPTPLSAVYNHATPFTRNIFHSD